MKILLYLSSPSSSVLVSSPEIRQGSTYTLTTGGENTTIEMTSLIVGTGGMMGGNQGKGGMRGGMALGNGSVPGEGGIDGSQPGDAADGGASGGGGMPFGNPEEGTNGFQRGGRPDRFVGQSAQGDQNNQSGQPSGEPPLDTENGSRNRQRSGSSGSVAENGVKDAVDGVTGSTPSAQYSADGTETV